jgi:Tfp pilus assembly protein PilN
MSDKARRTYAALIEPAGIWLFEFQLEKGGFRIVNHTSDMRRFDDAADAFVALNRLLLNQEFRRASVSIAIHQFGVFHHTITLPAADERVLRPVIRRDVQRTFGIQDPVVAFAAVGQPLERRGPERADAVTAPRQYFVVGMPRTVSDSLVRELCAPNLEVRCVTVVPEAIRRVYESTHEDADATAALLCLAGEPHLAFFINGRLELALDPPIALEGDRFVDPATILAQVERGVVYLRQQFRGAELKVLLLAAPAADQHSLTEMLEDRLGIRVKPLMPRGGSPEAVVAMGAVLAGGSPHQLDLYPHPPTFAERARESLRGTQGVSTGLSVAAAVIAFWAVFQITAFRRTEIDVQTLREQVNRGIPALAPVKELAQRRARYVARLAIADAVMVERDGLASQLAGVARILPVSVRIDSLGMARVQSGWAATVTGRVASMSAAESVRALNDFFQALQARPDITSSSLDQFDYLTAPTADSTHAIDHPVNIQFRISFSMRTSARGH